MTTIMIARKSFKSISPPFVASCTARLGSHGNNVSLVSFGCIAGRFRLKVPTPKSRLYYDWHALVNQVEQFNYIRIPHSHTTAAGGRADLVLVLGAVNVDVAVARIGIVLVQSVEPYDPRHDQILGLRNLFNGLKRHAASKNSAARGVGPNLLRDTETPGWRFHASHFRANAEPRSGHRVTMDQCVAVLQRKLLITDRYVDISQSLHRIAPAIN